MRIGAYAQVEISWQLILAKIILLLRIDIIRAFGKN